MRIRKFIGNNYTEALNLVKRELGGDALVLGTRALPRRQSSSGYKGTSQVEITAAIDPNDRSENNPADSNGQNSFTVDSFFKNDGAEDELKSLILTLLTKTDRAQAMGLKVDQIKIFEKLVQSGVSEYFATKIFEKINSGGNGNGISPSNLEPKISSLMKKVLACKGGIDLKGPTQKVVAFVGPTGAGKTTTIAKLAAWLTIKESRKVALVSLDTFKMGAVEQLRIYGEIMGVPVDTAADQKGFEKVLKSHSDKEVIFVDTMGRNHKDQSYPGYLKRILSVAPHLETHLVLSAASREELFSNSAKQFSSLGIDRAVITKLDEGMSFGSLFNFSVKTRIPFSYFTTGQRIPEDIEVAEKEKVISLIFN